MATKQIGDGGDVIDVGFDRDPRDQELDTLRRENRALQRELADATLAVDRAREDANRAMAMLRRQLAPLYRALQAVFGELDAASVTDGPAPSTQAGQDDRTAAKWAEWKQRLGPSCAKVIDALLLGGEMTVSALAVACRMGKNTVYAATSTMGRAGILTRNGSKFSLKP